MYVDQPHLYWIKEMGSLIGLITAWKSLKMALSWSIIDVYTVYSDSYTL